MKTIDFWNGLSERGKWPRMEELYLGKCTTICPIRTSDWSCFRQHRSEISSGGYQKYFEWINRGKQKKINRRLCNLPFLILNKEYIKICPTPCPPTTAISSSIEHFYLANCSLLNRERLFGFRQGKKPTPSASHGLFYKRPMFLTPLSLEIRIPRGYTEVRYKRSNRPGYCGD